MYILQVNHILCKPIINTEQKYNCNEHRFHFVYYVKRKIIDQVHSIL